MMTVSIMWWWIKYFGWVHCCAWSKAVFWVSPFVLCRLFSGISLHFAENLPFSFANVTEVILLHGLLTNGHSHLNVNFSLCFLLHTWLELFCNVTWYLYYESHWIFDHKPEQLIPQFYPAWTQALVYPRTAGYAIIQLIPKMIFVFQQNLHFSARLNDITFCYGCNGSRFT